MQRAALRYCSLPARRRGLPPGSRFQRLAKRTLLITLAGSSRITSRIMPIQRLDLDQSHGEQGAQVNDGSGRQLVAIEPNTFG